MKVNQRTYTICVDWMLEVAVCFKLLDDTLHLGCAIFHAFSEKSTVTTSKNLQGYAITSLWIASKLEETFGLPIADVVYVCDKNYTEEEVVLFEQTIIVELNGNLFLPTLYGLEKTHPNFSVELRQYLDAALFCREIWKEDMHDVLEACVAMEKKDDMFWSRLQVNIQEVILYLEAKDLNALRNKYKDLKLSTPCHRRLRSAKKTVDLHVDLHVSKCPRL